MRVARFGFPQLVGERFYFVTNDTKNGDY